MHGQMNDECVLTEIGAPPIGGAQLSSRGARAPPCPPLAPPLLITLISMLTRPTEHAYKGYEHAHWTFH